MNGLSYKGYDGSAEFSAEDKVFHGRLTGIRALVNYEADTAVGLELAFQEAVDDYLETCEQSGRKPETPYRGMFNVRTSRELHRRAALYAEAHGMKLNAVVNEALNTYLERAKPDPSGSSSLEREA